jgi:hypothetical protein
LIHEVAYSSSALFAAISPGGGASGI